MWLIHSISHHLDLSKGYSVDSKSKSKLYIRYGESSPVTPPLNFGRNIDAIPCSLCGHPYEAARPFSLYSHSALIPFPSDKALRPKRYNTGDFPNPIGIKTKKEMIKAAVEAVG